MLTAEDLVADMAAGEWGAWVVVDSMVEAWEAEASAAPVDLAAQEEWVAVVLVEEAVEVLAVVASEPGADFNIFLILLNFSKK